MNDKQFATVIKKAWPYYPKQTRYMCVAIRCAYACGKISDWSYCKARAKISKLIYPYRTLEIYLLNNNMPRNIEAQKQFWRDLIGEQLK